ncbi:hypothetical protein OOZ51_04970 [Arthrobacter sp. MI7-26]|uniref:hypothetical protein n=1 Tax=Arthrobacter sp. MI7-26 TaxID=2993653 RepID=UPI002248A700|nr:hypothetical protein [Arthrobacter sp. MI7-26]MCX2747166.1 hypothetical protein [Arthrobacter sp. MI7-26]
MSEMQGIQAAMAPLTKANVAEVMAQLEALLEALPADTSSDTDARLRHDIEVLLAGYKAGTPRQRPRTPATN